MSRRDFGAQRGVNEARIPDLQQVSNDLSAGLSAGLSAIALAKAEALAKTEASAKAEALAKAKATSEGGSQRPRGPARVAQAHRIPTRVIRVIRGRPKGPARAAQAHPLKRPREQNPGKSRKIPEKNKKTVRLAPTAKQKEPAQPPWPIMTNYQQLSLIKPFRVKNKKPPPCPAPIHKRGGDGSRRAARLERFSSRQFEKEGGQGYIGINRI